MSRNSIIDKRFNEKLNEVNVGEWCKKRNTYIKAKKKYQTYEGKLFSIVKPKMSESELKIFEKTLGLLKGALYDMEFEEKIFYYKEGYKEGIQLMKELI